jgi:uncharacterized protein YndB with AHSA1/START domain
MIDVVHEVNAVQRQVGTRVLEAGDARTVTVSRTYEAPLDDVWDAVTNPERLPRWFLPVSGDLRVGGRYELKGNASGTIESCDPPRSFTATWEYGGEVSWIELRLMPEHDNRTRFVLEHIAHVGDERWAQFGPGAVGVGWDLALRGLAMYLESGNPVDPSAAMAWTASEEGVQFIAHSSEAWGNASLAAGTDQAAAQAAAARTTAFYTPTET